MSSQFPSSQPSIGQLIGTVQAATEIVPYTPTRPSKSTSIVLSSWSRSLGGTQGYIRSFRNRWEYRQDLADDDSDIFIRDEGPSTGLSTQAREDRGTVNQNELYQLVSEDEGDLEISQDGR